MSQVHNNQQCKRVKGGFSQPPLNTLVGMTRGVGYFVKGVEPHQTPHKYSPACQFPVLKVKKEMPGRDATTQTVRPLLHCRIQSSVTS